MKKIIALVLAIVMMASISVIAFAETLVGDNTNVGATELVYTSSEGYVITVPVGQTFVKEQGASTYTAGGNVVASEVNIPLNKQLDVYVSSATSIKVSETLTITKGAWTLGDINDVSEDVVYTATATTTDTNFTVAGEVDLVDANGEDAFLTVKMKEGSTSAATGTAVLAFSTNGTAQVGNYKDILTFRTEVN